MEMWLQYGALGVAFALVFYSMNNQRSLHEATLAVIKDNSEVLGGLKALIEGVYGIRPSKPHSRHNEAE